MAKWTIAITVINTLDRTLKVTNCSSEWGKWGSRHDSIAPNSSAKFEIYSPSGMAYGPELFLTLSDVPPAGEQPYGTVNVHVDIPYSKANKLEISTGGVLGVSGQKGLAAHGETNYISDLLVYCKE